MTTYVFPLCACFISRDGIVWQNYVSIDFSLIFQSCEFGSPNIIFPKGYSCFNVKENIEFWDVYVMR
jgi:hypothetical protein